MQETWVQSLGWEDSPGEGKGYLLQYSDLENSIDGIVHGITELDMTEWLSLHRHLGFFHVLAIFFNLFIFNWRVIALQYCVDFYQTSTWISHRYTHVPSHQKTCPGYCMLQWTLGHICLFELWFSPDMCPGVGLLDHVVALFFLFSFFFFF